MTFSTRRLLGILILIAISCFIWVADSVSFVALQSSQFFTGWVLACVMIALAFYNVRKKLPFIPLGRAAAWTQFHIYAGYFTIFLFLLHTRWRFPEGALEVTLALLFWCLVVSGIVGLIISRVFPFRLTTRGEGILYERIPAFRKQLRDEMEALVVRSAAETNSRTISDFYMSQLATYFAKPRHAFYHLAQSERPLKNILEKIQIYQRYANAKEQEMLHEIEELVTLKNNLDYQFTLQTVLKGWLFIHIPLTYSLLILGVLHAVLAYEFYGGIG